MSRRSRLSRTSRAPFRLIQPRPIDCDRESEQTVKNSRVLANFFFEHRQNKYFKRFPIPDLHPKRSPWPDFRDQGVVFRAKNAGQKQLFLGRQACTLAKASLEALTVAPTKPLFCMKELGLGVTLTHPVGNFLMSLWVSDPQNFIRTRLSTYQGIKIHNTLDEIHNILKNTQYNIIHRIS